MAKNGLTDAEKCLAEKCADYVAGSQNKDAMLLSVLAICSTEDINMVAVYLQTFASSVLFNYIKEKQNSEDLADQLFGKAIQGK